MFRRMVSGWRVRMALPPRGVKRLRPRRTMRPPFTTIPPASPSLQGNNVRGGLYGIYLDPDVYQPPTRRSEQWQPTTFGQHSPVIPQLFLRYTPLEFSVEFGIGCLCALRRKHRLAAGHRLSGGCHERSLKYFRINPVIALKLAPNLSIGGGVMVDYGNIDLEQGLRASPQPPNFYPLQR